MSVNTVVSASQTNLAKAHMSHLSVDAPDIRLGLFTGSRIAVPSRWSLLRSTASFAASKAAPGLLSVITHSPFDTVLLKRPGCSQ